MRDDLVNGTLHVRGGVGSGWRGRQMAITSSSAFHGPRLASGWVVGLASRDAVLCHNANFESIDEVESGMTDRKGLIAMLMWHEHMFK